MSFITKGMDEARALGFEEALEIVKISFSFSETEEDTIKTLQARLAELKEKSRHE